MRTSPAALVSEHDHVRPIVERIGSVRPQMGVFRLAAAGIKLAHRCFIGMQATAFSEQFGQPVGQRLQRHADAPDPLGQRGARQGHTLACRNLFDPVQRQVVEVRACRYPDAPASQRSGGSRAVPAGCAGTDLDGTWRLRDGPRPAS